MVVSPKWEKTGYAADRPSVHLRFVTTCATQSKGVDTSYLVHKREIMINARVVGIIEIHCIKQLVWYSAHNTQVVFMTVVL